MIDYKADVLWLCEVGHHTDGLRGSKYTPKEILLESGEASRLMEHWFVGSWVRGFMGS